MDRLVAEFDKFQAKIKQAETQFAQVGEMQQELSDLEAEATSPDRAITVVAGPSGSIKDIRLTADALRLAPQQLASTILQTLHRAVAESARRQAGIVDAHVGEAFGIDVSEQVLEAQAEALGTTSEELSAQLPPEPANAEFDHNDVLRREAAEAAAPPPAPPARPRARRPDPDPDDDGYFQDQNLFGRGDQR
ncbi:YbaB/EbfC family nucleoid-associated protein [Amycolatopsis ultiminotia]